MKVDRGFWDGPKPPDQTEEANLRRLIQLVTVYPDRTKNIEIPDEWVASVVVGLRSNLELALDLEKEIGGYDLRNISPIVPDDAPDGDVYSRTHGLSGATIRFSSVFERLIQIDLKMAQHEFSRWSTDDDTIFARLRIWAAGKPELIPSDQFGAILANVSDEAFWDGFHARDLLVTLSSRWNALSPHICSEIENRLLRGPSRRDDEHSVSFEKRRAWSILDRVTWLSLNGCKLRLDLNAETERLGALAPEWKPESAGKSAQSLEVRSSWVKTETEYSALLLEPLASMLAKALELSGRRNGIFVEHAPYAGLSAECPVRAFAALRMAAKQNEFPEWAWRTFLDSEARKNDRPRLTAFIAEQLARYSDDAIAVFIRPATNWILTISRLLAAQYPASFDRVVSTLIQTLATKPKDSSSAILRGNKEPDWTMEALNGPAGKIAQTVFNDTRKDLAKIGEGFPQDWLGYVNDLLALPEDLRRHTLVIFAHRLNWFYAIDPKWSEENLLSVLRSDDLDDKNAFWAGFFWGTRALGQKLYFRLKPYLLKLAKQRGVTHREHSEVLAGIILVKWDSFVEGTNKRCITGDELRDVLLHADDEFRSQLLWHAERWSSEIQDGAENKWASTLMELLKNFWPRQKSATSPKMSARLCELAFSDKKRFPEFVEIILPLLTQIDDAHWMLPILNPANDNIPDLYPCETLSLLHAVLPENVSAWPYGIKDWLGRISEADSKLKTDERFFELKRKWDSR